MKNIIIISPLNTRLRLLLLLLPLWVLGCCCYAQATYTLPVASCQDPICTEDVLGIEFMCYNLGADPSLSATSYVVGNADGSGGTLGHLYQWGRPADGHQLRNSTTTNVRVGTDVPGHGNFIITPTANDWRGTSNVTRWGNTKTANDPCPAGFKVPQYGEISIIQTASIPVWTGNGVLADGRLYFPAAGQRSKGTGVVNDVGTVGYYWSVTANVTNGANSVNFYMDSSNGLTFGYQDFVNPIREMKFSTGASIRCIVE